MSTPVASVRVRQTTSTTTSSAAILVINTGYLKSTLGALKLIILVSSREYAEDDFIA